jgi:hypothetical protein
MADISSALAPANALNALAERIRTAHAAVGHAARNMLNCAMTAGDALIEARKQIAPGGWESWLKRECDLSVRTAERYVQLAKARALFEADPSRATGLSITGALRLLGNRPRARSTTTRTTNPNHGLDTLAWSEATLEARQKFLDGIGLPSLLKAMPPEWRPALVEYVLGLAEARDGERTKRRQTQPFDLELTAADAA